MTRCKQYKESVETSHRDIHTLHVRTIIIASHLTLLDHTVVQPFHHEGYLCFTYTRCNLTSVRQLLLPEYACQDPIHMTNQIPMQTKNVQSKRQYRITHYPNKRHPRREAQIVSICPAHYERSAQMRHRALLARRHRGGCRSADGAKRKELSHASPVTPHPKYPPCITNYPSYPVN